MASPDPDSPRRKRIAVIAIHGVADQQPDDTANTAANLLLHMQNDGASRYHGFKTHRLRIAHRPVKLQETPPSFEDPPDQSDPGGSSKRRTPSIPRDPSEKCQHQFLRGQLEKYAEPDPAATYETIRNEGVRRGDAPGNEREVHIYEMYWADLSRLGNSFLTFFVELYQLLFHLCTVGAKTARFAREQHSEIRYWRAFSRRIHCASYFIRLPIPIANLFVLAIIVLAASGEIPINAGVVRTIVIAAASVAVGVAIAFLLRRIVLAVTWPRVLFAVAAIIGGLWFAGNYFLRPVGSVAVALYIEVWIVLLVLLFCVLKAYDRRHPHALRWYCIVGAGASAFLLACTLFGVGNLHDVCEISAALLLQFVGLSWVVAIIAAGLAWIAGWRALSSTGRGKASARRAVFTANLTTGLTGAVMLIINIALWGLIPTLLQNIAPVKYDVIHTIAREMQAHLTGTTIIPGMTTLVGLMAAAAVWMIWALIPAVRSEITTPPPEAESSRWIGDSLTNAFRVMTKAGLLAMACFGGLLALLSVLKIVRTITDRFGDPFPGPFRYLDRWDKPTADVLFTGFSGTILLFLIAPFFLKGFMAKLSAGFRQGLDVALDVINYLREHPRDATIRAQIFARYVSLLRYICNWRSPIDGEGYDGIVIFAHSQGSIITVDLLRFLKDEPDPDLKFLATPDGIQLFTMGCPLRQLYGLRFPHIYDWARHPGDRRPKPCVAQGDAGRDPALPAGDTPLDRTLPEKQRPDPTRLLSVSQWVNAYRSGDYVGRNLWRSEKDDDVYALDDVSEDATGMRREFCIGGGAHTHYWDKTAPTIVAELDRLIATDPRDPEPTADNGSTSR